ncbi:MAG: nucleotidyltransferase domain-containing protein, partial [Verrucomicrobiota bacterium]
APHVGLGSLRGHGFTIGVVSIVKTALTAAMPEVHPLVRKLIPLPAQVRNHLHQVAKKQARLGVRMFLFGSVARTWPQAHIGADLDIGYEIDANRIDRADRLESLERDIEALPLIRPVDLVDFSKAGEAFRARAFLHTVELADDSVATATE